MRKSSRESRLEPKGLKKTKLVNLCVSKWPKLGTHWPKEGSFDQEQITLVRRKLAQRNKWSELPYVTLWEAVGQNRTKLQMLCKLSQNPGDDEVCEEIILWAQRQQPVRQQTPQMTDDEQPVRQQTPQKPDDRKMDPEEKATQYIKDATQSMKEHVQEVEASTPRSTRRVTRQTQMMAPLREVPVSTPTGIESRIIYVPFSTTDLAHWRESMPRLRDNSEKVFKRFDTIFST